MKLLTPLVVSLALIAGCSTPITKQEKQSLADPVDCSTAVGDMRTLTAEKAHVSKEIEDGATAIIPIGLVVHLIERDEKDTFEVGFGEYNRALDKKIADIQKQCNVK